MAASSAPPSAPSGSASLASDDSRQGLLLFFVASCYATLLSSCYELLVRQTGAYLALASPARLSAVYGLAALGALSATALCRWRRPPRRVLPALLLLLALLVGASGLLAYWSFASRIWAQLLPCALAFGCAFLASATALVVFSEVVKPALQLDVLSAAVQPFRVFFGGSVIAVVVGAMTLIGLMRSAAAHGALLALLCPLWLALESYLYPRRKADARLPALAAYGVAGLAGSGLLLAETRVPLAEVGDYPGRIVYASSSGATRYVFTAAQESFSLFVDTELKSSGVDDYRYYEALVHPLLASAPLRARCLVLGGGDGMVARELLRYTDVTSITLVVPDLALVELTRNVPWLNERAQGALSAPRVQLIEAEALPWLLETSQRYDVVIVDAADPSRFGPGKQYTRYFYQLVAAHLETSGVAALQATSLSRSPETVRTILATLEAADLVALPYRAPIPTLGEWAFVLAAKTALVPPTALATTLQGPLRFLNAGTLLDLFSGGTFEHRATAEPSLLYRQHAVDVYRRDREGE